jgi:hypothetical protein
MKSSNRDNKRPKQKKTVRENHQKKPSSKGKKSLRGQPELYDEVKKPRSFGITLTALAGLDEISRELSISKSELIERIGRQLIQLQASSIVSSATRADQSQVHEYDRILCTEKSQ